jgi:hypothetical protein
MHTAICTFDDPAAAQQAVERLVQAGFDRDDIHMEHRHSDGSPMEAPANDAWDGLEREVAVSRGVAGKFDFFEHLFGEGDAAAHRDKYTRAAERGHCVVIVDAPDEASAERAQNVLHGIESREFQLLHRAGMRPVRDIVAQRRASGLEERFGTAREDMAAPHRRDVKGGDTELFPPEERERAMASHGWGEQRTLPLIPDEPPSAGGGPRDGDFDDKPR